MRTFLFSALLLSFGLLTSVTTSSAQSGGSPGIASSSTTITVSGQGSKGSAAEALQAVEAQMKAVDEKGAKLSKSALKKTSYNVSFSNTVTYTGLPSDGSQSWTYNFSSSYTLSDGKDVASLADELAKGGITVSVTSDVTLQ